MGLISFFTSLYPQSTPISQGFNDTIPFALNHNIDNAPNYHWNGDYLQNPVNGNFIHLFANGASHIWDVNKKISYRFSDDFGATFSSVLDAYDPAGFGTQDIGGGFDVDGTLHMFTSALSGTGPGDTKELRYFTSEQIGPPFSTARTIATPSDGLATHRVLGTMIEVSGVLFKPMYKVTDEGDVSESAIYVMRSINRGATWSFYTVKAKSSLYYNEGCIIGLGGNNMLFMARDEVNKGWRQYRSTDLGLTWSPDGNTQMGETIGTSTPKPASLRAIGINSTRVICFMSYNQNTDQKFIVYAKAADIINNGIAGWNLATKYNLEQSATVRGGYGNAIYLNNTLEGKAVTYDDPDQQEDSTWYMTLKTTHYQSLITELGL